MAFDKYRTQPSAFGLYYDKFLQNTFRVKRFRITLTTGESKVGVPMAGSMASPADPDVAFMFRDDAGASYRIPFSDLNTAEELPA